MFYETFLQKSQELVGGITVRCNEDNDLFNAILCFVIAGLRESVPIVVQQYLKWLAEEIKVTIRQINAAGFNVSIFI